MIPTVLLAAFVGALVLPGRVAWVIAACVIGWVIALIVGVEDGAAALVGGAALALLNAAVGAAVGVVVRKAPWGRPRSR